MRDPVAEAQAIVSGYSAGTLLEYTAIGYRGYADLRVSTPNSTEALGKCETFQQAFLLAARHAHQLWERETVEWTETVAGMWYGRAVNRRA